MNIFVENGGSSATFATTAQDNAWNGACLAIAELCRARLINKEQLPQVMPWILKVDLGPLYIQVLFADRVA